MRTIIRCVGCRLCVPCAFRIFHIFANCRASHFNDCHFSCFFRILLAANSYHQLYRGRLTRRTLLNILRVCRDRFAGQAMRRNVSARSQYSASTNAPAVASCRMTHKRLQSAAAVANIRSHTVECAQFLLMNRFVARIFAISREGRVCMCVVSRHFARKSLAVSLTWYCMYVRRRSSLCIVIGMRTNNRIMAFSL